MRRITQESSTRTTPPSVSILNEHRTGVLNFSLTSETPGASWGSLTFRRLNIRKQIAVYSHKRGLLHRKEQASSRFEVTCAASRILARAPFRRELGIVPPFWRESNMASNDKFDVVRGKHGGSLKSSPSYTNRLTV